MNARKSCNRQRQKSQPDITIAVQHVSFCSFHLLTMQSADACLKHGRAEGFGMFGGTVQFAADAQEKHTMASLSKDTTGFGVWQDHEQLR